MSPAPHDTINVPDARIGKIFSSHIVAILNYRCQPIGAKPYPPQSAPSHAPQHASYFVDGSNPILPMYLEMVEEEDVAAENWIRDANGISTIVRLNRLYLLIWYFTLTPSS